MPYIALFVEKNCKNLGAMEVPPPRSPRCYLLVLIVYQNFQSVEF